MKTLRFRKIVGIVLVLLIIASLTIPSLLRPSNNLSIHSKRINELKINRLDPSSLEKYASQEPILGEYAHWLDLYNMTLTNLTHHVEVKHLWIKTNQAIVSRQITEYKQYLETAVKLTEINNSFNSWLKDKLGLSEKNIDVNLEKAVLLLSAYSTIVNHADTIIRYQGINSNAIQEMYAMMSNYQDLTDSYKISKAFQAIMDSDEFFNVIKTTEDLNEKYYSMTHDLIPIIERTH